MSKLFWQSLLTFFGLGLIPKAPGTWGSLGGLVLWFALWGQAQPVLYGAALVLVLVLSILAFQQLNVQADDSHIVIDEVLGMGIALIAIDGSTIQALIAFGLFRLFDITKPPGVRYFDERFLRGWGVMMDDVIAGVYVLILLGAWNVFVPML